ncbi:hypothetical protein CANINC_002132 [Pichia inconspicua]|uniref:DNA topoisomerase n=1 Tax=Pichia inconspicua TaxID=52247 RepID=A0A4T0X3M4_9ASCO|nr:hypothetical protein CANINC_002132 [[Candida] inconspicua]
MKILCVAEKNSIAKSVAQTLSKGNFQTNNSKNKYIKNYTFQYNFREWGNCDVVMTSVAGHLLEKRFANGYEWGRVPHDALLTCPVIDCISDAHKTTAENIAFQARDSDVLIIWTDCDREGEYIGWEIMVQAQKGKPLFDLDSTYRAKFSHLEASHIHRAANNPGKLDKNAIGAVDARIEFDLRTGYCFTRLLTDSFRPVLPSDQNNPTNSKKSNNNKTISYGNCQFPTLGFVVDRFKRRKFFVPETFWYLDLSIKKGRKKYPFTWSRGHLFDRLFTVCLYQSCISNKGDKVVVKSCETKPSSRYAPLPLTTVELQKDCSRYFKFNAKETLNIAEKLYTRGLISYPRTETDSFPRSLDLKKLIEEQMQSPDWGEYAKDLVYATPSKFRVPRRGKNDDEAHPPIHPVKCATDLTGKEKTIYEYVVRRFLACCSHDAKGQNSTVLLQWHSEMFSASGSTVIEKNFLDIYKYSKWVGSTKELPNVSVGEELQIAEALVKSGETAPPGHLTETELIALMDQNGIGTDATIAEHIDKIIERQYVTRTKLTSGRSSTEVLLPTILGYGLVDGFSKIELEDLSLTKPFLRKDIEDDLKLICSGQKDKNEMLQQNIRLFKDAYWITDERKSVLIKAYKDALHYSQST